MNSLKELREEIDKIDLKLVELLERRAALVLEVKNAKKKEGADIYSPERERQIIENVLLQAQGGNFPKAALEKIFSSIISGTRSLIGELTIAYLGPENSPAYAALIKQFGEAVNPSAQFEVSEVIKKVENGDAHYGVVPAAYASSGLELKTFEGLLQSKLHIISEVELKEGARFFVLGHNVLSPSGSDKTFLLASVREKAGALREILEPFSKKNITLLKIESKNLKDHPGEHVFLIELKGHHQDKAVKEALDAVKALAASFKVFGSYPISSHSY